MIRGPKRKNSATLLLVPANCVRASKLRLGGNLRAAGDSCWGRQCAFGRKSVSSLVFAFGPAKRVWAAKRVWPVKRVSPAEFEQCSTSKTTSHHGQQTHLPPGPANRRPASKRVHQTPLATVGGCQRENKQALTALRRRR